MAIALTVGMREPGLDATGYGRLVWRLRRSHNQYLSYQLGRCGADFVLLIRDHARDTVTFAASAADMSSLLSLARLLRVAYVSAGWQTCVKRRSEHAEALTMTA